MKSCSSAVHTLSNPPSSASRRLPEPGPDSALIRDRVASTSATVTVGSVAGLACLPTLCAAA